MRQVAFIFSEENSLDFKQSVQDSFRLALYSCISGNHHSFLLPLAGAIESFSKGLEMLEELEEKTSYHHTFSDTIQGYISQLQKEKGLE
jgi:hypothetical protein